MYMNGLKVIPHHSWNDLADTNDGLAQGISGLQKTQQTM